MGDVSVTIFHNPNCGTSRHVLGLIEAAGHRPVVVDYLKTGWTRPQLQELLAVLGASPRDILRRKGAAAGRMAFRTLPTTKSLMRWWPIPFWWSGRSS